MNNKPLVDNVKVYGMEDSLRAAKYPMSVDISTLNAEITKGVEGLAKCDKGTGHDQFLTGITVQFDLSCSLKMWLEAERYRFLFFVSSQSTMHKITEFPLDESYNEYVEPMAIERMKVLVSNYRDTVEAYGKNSEEAKEAYLRCLYNNPSGFILTARMSTTYRSLKTMYDQRWDHRLPEWRELSRWIKTLPNSYLITG